MLFCNWMLSITSPVTAASKVSESEHNVARVNSIKKLYKHWRQESKVPTFALTYDGTYITLMKNLGMTEALAKSIEENYHKLYAVSDAWVADKIKQASIDGYITAAFGLRVRTPLLHQVVMGTSKTPHEAASEGRTAGNALGQSWCMLNNRAASEFMSLVRAGEHRLNIKPCAHIHDAQYYLIKDDMKTLMYVNEHLSNAVRWQEDPLLENEHIAMSGQLEIFHPTWCHGFDIPNETNEEETSCLIKKHLNELAEKGIQA
jgi:DNA polymerase-1